MKLITLIEIVIWVLYLVVFCFTRTLGICLVIEWASECVLRNLFIVSYDFDNLGHQEKIVY